VSLKIAMAELIFERHYMVKRSMIFYEWTTRHTTRGRRAIAFSFALRVAIPSSADWRCLRGKREN
jgi:hypothetical protein